MGLRKQAFGLQADGSCIVQLPNLGLSLFSSPALPLFSSFLRASVVVKFRVVFSARWISPLVAGPASIRSSDTGRTENSTDDATFGVRRGVGREASEVGRKAGSGGPLQGVWLFIQVRVARKIRNTANTMRVNAQRGSDS